MPDPFEAHSAKSPFIPGTQIQWAWDSTSLGWFKECPRKYYYHMICGYVPRAEAIHLEFGILYHGALERYDRLRFTGYSHDQALIAVVEGVLRATWRDGKPWRASADLPAEDRASLKCREFLVRSVIWYLDKFENDSAQTRIMADGSGPMVEMHFQFEIDMDWRGHPFALCGYLDRIVMFNELPFVMDRKTTTTTVNSRYFDKYDPDNQMSMYTLASQVAFKNPVKGVIVDAAQIMVGGTQFQRGVVQKSQEQIDEWLADTKRWIGSAINMAIQGQWPMNDKSCHNYGGCPFIKICSSSPNVRQSYLDSNFEKRPWNPLELRG